MNEEIKAILAVRARIVEDMAKFASKRSVSHEAKCANATLRRAELAAIDKALLLAFGYDVKISGY